MSKQPIPIIVCGRRADIATAVKQGLEPEVEVIHTILSLESGLHELPQLLGGKVPEPLVDESGLPQLGTQNYAQGRHAAVVLGGGYDNEMIATMRQACKDVSTVPWLQQDYSKPAEIPPGSPGYLERVVNGVKGTLLRLKDEGKDVGDGVYYY